MKKMKKIETNTSKKPMKRLIALWVVFVMLIVPFANHVGKNDVKAEGETENTGKGTLAVTDPEETTITIDPLSLEQDETTNALKEHTGKNYTKTYCFLKGAQKITKFNVPTYSGLQ